MRGPPKHTSTPGGGRDGRREGAGDRGGVLCGFATVGARRTLGHYVRAREEGVALEEGDSGGVSTVGAAAGAGEGADEAGLSERGLEDGAKHDLGAWRGGKVGGRRIGAARVHGGVGRASRHDRGAER